MLRIHKIVQRLFRSILIRVIKEEEEFSLLALLVSSENTVRNARLFSQINFIGQDCKFNGKIIITDPACVSIGNNVHIGDNAYFNTMGGLVIGDNTHISRNVSIYTQNHNYNGNALPYDDSHILKPVSIGKNVWIGMNVSIIPGVSIGDGAIIGMGTVVSQNVPPRAIVGNQPHRIVRTRDELHYQILDSNNDFGGVNGKKLDNDKSFSSVPANVMGSKIVFVVSTGRSGSQSFAEMFDSSENVVSLHEPHRQLVRLSTELAHGVKSRDEVKNELLDWYVNTSCFSSGKIYIESDQKLSNLIDILNEILPQCKFLWLIRRADEFVASAYPRGWFDKNELNRAENEKHINKYWATYRLNGYKCGAFSAQAWDSMDTFERNCWYWTYWNTMIQQNLEKISSDRWYKLRLEDMAVKLPEICSFIGIDPSFVTLVHGNKAKGYSTISKKNWSEDMKYKYNFWCAESMNTMYETTVSSYIKE